MLMRGCQLNREKFPVVLVIYTVFCLTWEEPVDIVTAFVMVLCASESVCVVCLGRDGCFGKGCLFLLSC